MLCRVPGIEVEQSGKLFKSNSIGFKTNGTWMFSKNEVLWWLWRVDPFALYNFLPSFLVLGNVAANVLVGQQASTAATCS